MERRVAHVGQVCVCFALRTTGTSPGYEFLEQLNAEEPRQYRKLLGLFLWLGDHGWINNRERFKPIENTEFFEFKNGQVRMPCYRVGNSFIITHGFIKKKNKIDSQEIDRARLIKKEDDARVKARNR